MFWKNETNEYGVQESLRLYADYPGSVSALFFSPCAKAKRLQRISEQSKNHERAGKFNLIRQRSFTSKVWDEAVLTNLHK